MKDIANTSYKRSIIHMAMKLLVIVAILIPSQVSFAQLCKITNTYNGISQNGYSVETISADIQNDIAQVSACYTALNVAMLNNTIVTDGTILGELAQMQNNKIIQSKIIDIQKKAVLVLDDMIKARKSARSAAEAFVHAKGAENAAFYGALFTNDEANFVFATEKLDGYLREGNKARETVGTLGKPLIFAENAGKCLDWLQAGMKVGDFAGTFMVNGYDQGKADQAAVSVLSALYPPAGAILGGFDVWNDISGANDDLATLFNVYANAVIGSRNYLNNAQTVLRQAGKDNVIYTTQDILSFETELIAIIVQMEALEKKIPAVAIISTPYVITSGKQVIYGNILGDFRTVLKQLKNVVPLTFVQKYWQYGQFERKNEQLRKYFADVQKPLERLEAISSNSLHQASLSPYLEIKAPTSVRTLSMAPDKLRLVEGDVLKLYPRNVSGWSNFSALTGTIKIHMLDSDYNDYLLFGTLLPDGGVQVVIPSGMPATYYKILAVFDLVGGVRNDLVIFSTYQLLELDSVSTTTGTTPPPSTTGTITLPRTGQYRCYDPTTYPYNEIPCAGTGQDGDIQAGKRWSTTPRFKDNGDQTMTDTVTGLIWTKDSNAPAPDACGPGTTKTWQGALDYVDCLNSNNFLTYNDWRLPNMLELKSIADLQRVPHYTWLNTQGFKNVESDYYYWSSSSLVRATAAAWLVNIFFGDVEFSTKTNNGYVWPVRGGQ